MLLPKWFIKNYKNTENPKVRKSYGILSGIVGIIFNLILSCGKVIAGVLFASLSILADGLNNLSDAGSSVVSLVGFKIAERPPDKEHPFGHARVEYIAGMIISFIILFIGAQLVITSVEGIIAPAPQQFSIVAVIILGGSILIKLYLSLLNFRMSKAIHSPTLKATAVDSLSDVITTSAVLIALLVSHYTGAQLDAYMGLLVAGFILFSGIKILREITGPLLGERPNSQLIQKIYEGIHSHEKVLGIHDLVVHNYGYERNFASVHVEVDSREDILDSHEMIDTIEREFLAKGIHLVIHLDPIVTGDERSNFLKEQVENILAEIDESLSMHDFRMVPGKTRTNLIFDLVVPEKLKWSDGELCETVQRLVHEKDSTLYTVISVDRNYL